MCGITGWVDFGGAPALWAGTESAMVDTMACRGPDAAGLWRDQHAMMGHRRLAVIDVDGGRQPMTAEVDGRVAAVLTYSGEVYNFRELRSQLASHGYRFRTRSDTEVVLAAYQCWGEDMADRLVGMYAFAVWDPGRRQLLLVRDRLGVKPLYYLPTPNGALFGSEPKAILAHPLASRRVDAEGLCEALDVVRTPGHAVYAGMREVLPGELVRVGPSGVSRRTYWALKARPHTDDLPTTVSTVRSLLQEAVTQQLVTDVPLCSLLSGGLDSSAVTAIASAAAADGEPLRTFAVDFAAAGEGVPDATADRPFARVMAEHAGTNHREILLESEDLLRDDVRAAAQHATDLPLHHWGDMWVSLLLLFREVRRHSTVALSGEAADEIFGGYFYFHQPPAVHEETFPWIGAPGQYFDGTGLLDPGLLHKLDIAGYRRQRYGEALAEVPELPGEEAGERRMRQLGYLTITRLLRILLDRKDRMSMAVGLEVRVPFCDHRLVEYLFNVPWAMKAFDGKEKSLLRAAVADLLPPAVRNRPKRGYPMTQDGAYEAGLRAALRKLLRSPDAPVLPLLDNQRVREAASRPVGQVSRQYDRGAIEVVLGLNMWLAANDVTLDL